MLEGVPLDLDHRLEGRRIPGPVVLQLEVLVGQGVEVLDERPVGVPDHLAVWLAEPEVADVVVVLAGVQALGQLQQGQLTLADADDVDELQGLLRHRRRVEATPDEVLVGEALLDRTGGLERDIEHRGEEGDAYQVAVLDEVDDVIDEALAHLLDVAGLEAVAVVVGREEDEPDLVPVLLQVGRQRARAGAVVVDRRGVDQRYSHRVSPVSAQSTLRRGGQPGAPVTGSSRTPVAWPGATASPSTRQWESSTDRPTRRGGPPPTRRVTRTRRCARSAAGRGSPEEATRVSPSTPKAQLPPA